MEDDAASCNIRSDHTSSLEPLHDDTREVTSEVPCSQVELEKENSTILNDTSEPDPLSGLPCQSETMYDNASATQDDAVSVPAARVEECESSAPDDAIASDKDVQSIPERQTTPTNTSQTGLDEVTSLRTAGSQDEAGCTVGEDDSSKKNTFLSIISDHQNKVISEVNLSQQLDEPCKVFDIDCSQDPKSKLSTNISAQKSKQSENQPVHRYSYDEILPESDKTVINDDSKEPVKSKPTFRKTVPKNIVKKFAIAWDAPQTLNLASAMQINVNVKLTGQQVNSSRGPLRLPRLPTSRQSAVATFRSAPNSSFPKITPRPTPDYAHARKPLRLKTTPVVVSLISDDEDDAVNPTDGAAPADKPTSNAAAPPLRVTTKTQYTSNTPTRYYQFSSKASCEEFRKGIMKQRKLKTPASPSIVKQMAPRKSWLKAGAYCEKSDDDDDAAVTSPVRRKRRRSGDDDYEVGDDCDKTDGYAVSGINVMVTPIFSQHASSASVVKEEMIAVPVVKRSRITNDMIDLVSDGSDVDVMTVDSGLPESTDNIEDFIPQPVMIMPRIGGVFDSSMLETDPTRVIPTPMLEPYSPDPHTHDILAPVLYSPDHLTHDIAEPEPYNPDPPNDDITERYSPDHFTDDNSEPYSPDHFTDDIPEPYNSDPLTHNIPEPYNPDIPEPYSFIPLTHATPVPQPCSSSLPTAQAQPGSHVEKDNYLSQVMEELFPPNHELRGCVFPQQTPH